MYPPPHHQSEEIEKMLAVIRQFPLGMLVTALDSIPFCTHIPFIYNEKTGKLIAHIDRENQQMATLKDGATVTVIFKGPETYISPSVYSTKQLPTFNYIVVHITGTLQLLHDADAVKQSMVAMTEFLEAPEQKFTLENDDPRMERLINYIQAFEIEITHWEGKFKLSQDKNGEDHLRAKNELIKKSNTDSTGFIEYIYMNLHL